MKLATYQDGSRDGQLVVVSRDLGSAHYATGIASRLQQVLDDWSFLAPQLQDLSVELNHGRARHAFPFDPALCLAPLPRAYQWAGSTAYPHHVALMRQPSAPELPTEPLMYQGASDSLLGPRAPIVAASEALGIDFEAGLAVITGDVQRGASPEQALDGIRLVMLANGVTLRSLMPGEQATGCGLLHSKPATAFSPVAVTLDELAFNGESAWQGGRLHLTLQSTWNGRKVGMCEAGPEMGFHFGQLIAHLAKTRPVRTGSIVGSGPVSNQDRTKGYACIAEKRAIETIDDGQPGTAFMRYGDTIRIEVKGRDGHSVFGAIEQEVTPLPDGVD
ncbi:MAG TPA: fumarylacetoacetate hydrolase family protein [Burkholderiaceae bacterium]